MDPKNDFNQVAFNIKTKDLKVGQYIYDA